MAKQTFMSRVKAYRKVHPRISQVDAMKKLAGKKPVKRKVGSKTQRSTSQKKAVTAVGSHRRKSTPGLSRGVAIARKIEGLELLLKNTAGTAVKNHVKRLINAEHDKLDSITKNLKSA